MPGIYGVINYSGEFISDEDIAKSAKTAEFYSDKKIKSGSFSGGLISRNTSIQNAEKNGILFILYGDIFAFGGTRFTDNINELLDHYLTSGDKLFDEMNGEFCIVIWDENKKVLKIVTDHLGTKPIYYFNDENHTIIAPDVKSILNVINENTLNLDAVREFLTFGFCLSDNTFIQNIKLALPGHIIQLGKKVSKKEYWAIQDFIRSKKTTKKFDELIKEHQQLLNSAINKRIPKNKTICVSLSGGLDSRTIVAYLGKHDHKNIVTTTFGVRNCLDEKYAKAVSKKLNLPNTFHELDPARIKKSFHEIISRMDGMLSVKHIHDYPFLPEKYQEWDTHITGYFGDPIHGQRLFPSNPLEPDVSRAKTENELLKMLVKKHSQYGLKGCKLLNEENGQEKLLNSVRNVVEQSRLSHPLQVSDYFDLHERQRRFIAQIFQLAGMVFDYKMPFTDKSLVEFCLRLPTSYRKKQKLAKASFIDGFPDLSKISLQKTHTHLKASKTREKISELVYYFQYAFKRLVEVATKGRKSYRPPHIYDPYDEWSRKEFKQSIQGILLDEKTLSRDLYNTEEIRRIVAQHMSGRKNYEEAIYLLYTFEMWYRLFMDDRKCEE